jgi:lysophospholipase L1-like esterase
VVTKHRLVAGIATVLTMAMAPVGFAAAQRVERVEAMPADLSILPVRVHGRVERAGDERVRQWPGSYFEAAFDGATVLFTIGSGEVGLHVMVDGRAIDTLVRPAPGVYRVDGLPRGRHDLRIEVASESQAGPTRLGAFYAPRRTAAPSPQARARQIEFIGDSHTVGYGVTSAKRACTQDEIWRTTDTSRGFGALLARRYGADYEVNAISGRGVVRNYNGFAADTLPEAYPYTLFDRRSRAVERDWHPGVIVVALGTNDFTTPLHTGEKWTTRDALHADYEARYVSFVQALRARNPKALIVLWATDLADGEIQAEVAKVVALLRAAGEQRLAYVPVNGLSFTGCNAHPSLADQTVIAERIAGAIETQGSGWGK